MSKERLEGNKAVATLFVGVGGIGSKIIREVVDIARRSDDDLSKAQFVILDTDKNDLGRADDGVQITAIQTSSPRTIRDYLIQDTDARDEWFPNNMIINGKTVSEGAGQVRAISRLALNATIKTGKIKGLYDAIDALYNKDGSDAAQAIKVVIASTVAGGTGSGIAMIVGMLIRNYLAKNYPSSAAIIRGFLIMPDVLNTVNPTSSEELSLARNGYATLKEINAFMMRPFFEAVPELNRYLDLHVDVPNSAGGVDRLKTSPFDFCFLYERTDNNTSKMEDLAQYRSYAAHSIYEQCIGPMSGKASSKEDNIHKEFLAADKFSRNRFGGAGASIIRYPFEAIRDYLAFEWIEKQILGHSGKELDEAALKKMVEESWLAFDQEYHNRMAEFKAGNLDVEPQRAEVYISGVETGSNAFSKMLREKYVEPKNVKHSVSAAAAKKATSAKATQNFTIPAVEGFVRELELRACYLYETAHNAIKKKKNLDDFKYAQVGDVGYERRYNAIIGYNGCVIEKDIEKTVRSFIERNFNSNIKIDNKLESFAIESFVSIDGKALHPNAMRYMLYKLYTYMDGESINEPIKGEEYKSRISEILNGKPDQDGKIDLDSFQVNAVDRKEEKNLRDMCIKLDKAEKSWANLDDTRSRCNKKLDSLAEQIDDSYMEYVHYYVCNYAKRYVERLIVQFEKFYDKFRSKTVGLEKRKKSILTQIGFDDGDCEYNLFSKPEHLQKFVDLQRLPVGGTQEERELFADIYDAVKENGKNSDIARNDTFADVNITDVFEDVIVEKYREIVEASSGVDMDILRAIGKEYEIITLCKADRNTKDAEEILKSATKEVNKNAYLERIIQKGYNLACPSIIRKSFEEDRAIESMSFNAQMEEGDGMKMPESLFSKDFASNSVSKYELHFFRSIYGLTPLDIHKLTSPQCDPASMVQDNSFDAETEPGMVGTYFTAYQDYMRLIGPDNRLNPVITPHIDKRWNSLTVLPEIDPTGYQKVLMKRIHKAFIYGFIFGCIERREASAYDTEKLVYEYVDGRNGTKKLIVSNHTKCDRLFEVLDALYFDRYAVHSIHETVDNIRDREFKASTPYERTTFAKYLKKIDREILLDIKGTILCGDDCDEEKKIEEVAKTLDEKQVSLFEIPMLYWNSLPKKDASELDVMIDAIFEIIEKEIRTFADKDNFDPLVAKLVRDHYNLLYANYEACRELYDNHGSDPKNNRAFKVIRKKVLEKIDDLDVTKAKFRLVDYSEKDDLLS